MKRALAKLKLAHLVLAVFLAATLWFPSTREAHSLCFRLLLHLKGDKFVQGQTSGCIIYTVPNTQFSPQKTQLLRSHSKDSLDAYALAIGLGEQDALPVPKLDGSWNNHPLLPWMAVRFAWVSTLQRDTNRPALQQLSPATVESARQALQLAQSLNATNGALWLAEACVEFDEGHDAAALAALQIAATNRMWNANLSVGFSNLACLYQSAGLSELDAAGQANWAGIESSAVGLQSACSRQLERLMTMAIHDGNDAEFTRLLEIMTMLRGAEWEDKPARLFNTIALGKRHTDDLDNAMAAKLGRSPLPKDDDKDYARRREISRRIFQDFFNQISDQRLAAIYLTQSERVSYEKRLRSEIFEQDFRGPLWWGVFASLAGMFAPLLLTLLVVSLVLELAIWKLGQSQIVLREAMLRPKFLSGLFVAALGFALLTSNFGISMGINSKVGFGLVETPPLIHPDLADFLVVFLVSLIVLLAVCFWSDKLRAEIKFKFGQLTALVFGAYLVLILLMAFCRHHLADLLAAQYG